MTNIRPPVDQLARELVEQFSQLSEVEAVVLSGSQATERHDDISDIDLYVYARDGLVRQQARREMIKRRAQQYEINNKFWEMGDEWIEKDSGIHVDIMYRDVGWVIDEVQRVLVYHKARIGYSTAIWHNVLYSVPYFDRGGWFEELQKTTRQPYPDALLYAVIHKNHPILRKSLSSYKKQILRALERGDHVSVHHRSTAFVASYFDVLFALNRMPHPGEKRMLAIAEAQCAKQPPHMREQVLAMLYGNDPLTHLDDLVDGLDDLLIAEGMLPGRVK